MRSNERLSPSSSCDIASVRLKFASSSNALLVVTIPVSCVILSLFLSLIGRLSAHPRLFFRTRSRVHPAIRGRVSPFSVVCSFTNAESELALTVS